MDALRSITNSLPAPINNLGISLIGETCYKKLVLDIDTSSTECFKLAFSKILGLAIVGGASIVKLPQILKLTSSKSAEGLSFLSYLLETSAMLIGLSYNFRSGNPFSTYGETALLLIQNIVISVLVLQYSGKTSMAAVLVAGLAAAGATLFSPNILDMKSLSYFQMGAGLLGVASKLPQIMAIYQQGGTGQLSAFGVFNYLFGSGSRIFTTLQEVNDKLILFSFVSAFALNLVIAGQMVYYWNAPSKQVAAKQKEAQIEGAMGSTSGASKGKSPTTRRRA